MNKVVKLTTPVELFSKMVTEVTLKEPKGGTYVRLGEPRTLVFSATGSGYYVEQPEVISKYLEACVDYEQPVPLIGLLSLEDAMAVKETLFSFFAEAAQRRAALK